MLEKLATVMVVMLASVGGGGLFGYALASVPVCNTKQIDPFSLKKCDADYDHLTWCVNRNSDGCLMMGPGAAGDGEPSGAEWNRACKEYAGLNTDHCVTSGFKCLQKYWCTYATGCEAGEKYQDFWWYTNQASSPDCVPPAGS